MSFLLPSLPLVLKMSIHVQKQGWQICMETHPEGEARLWHGMQVLEFYSDAKKVSKKKKSIFQALSSKFFRQVLEYYAASRQEISIYFRQLPTCTPSMWYNNDPFSKGQHLKAYKSKLKTNYTKFTALITVKS